MGQKTDSLFSRMLFTVGFGAHVALQLLGLFGSALPFPGVVSPDVALACQTLFFVSLISATALLANNVNWVISHARLVMAASTALALAAAALLSGFVALPSSWLFGRALSWALFGFALCGFRACWAARMALISTAPVDMTLSGAYLFGGALVALAAFFGDAAALMSIVLACIVLTAASMALLARREAYRDIGQLMQWKQFERVQSGSVVRTAALGVLFGFAIAAAVSLGEQALFPSMVGLFVGRVVACVAIVQAKKRAFDLAVTLKRLLPSVWVVFLLFPLLPFEGRIGCCCVILGALVYNHINYNILLLTRSMRHRLNPITHEFVSENPHWLGMLVGIVLAFFAFYQFPLSDVELLIAEIVCFVFAAVYLLKGGIDSAGRQGPSCLDGASSEASRADQALDEQSFDEACDALMERVGLTKREMDVFRLLARGRNNEYISNKLFISRATTKTHIYHIYAKTGVNSQQDLINFVEQELEEDRRRP